MKRSLFSPHTPMKKRFIPETTTNNVLNFTPKITPSYARPNKQTAAESTSGTPYSDRQSAFAINPPQEPQIPTTKPREYQANHIGVSSAEKTYFFTGSVERLIKWHRAFKNHPCYFEVIASVVVVRDGSINLQKIILLKDQKGPILQVVYYLNHGAILENIEVGQILRCVGYMSGSNILNALSIRAANQEEVATLKRYCYVGDFAISRLISAKENNATVSKC